MNQQAQGQGIQKLNETPVLEEEFDAHVLTKVMKASYALISYSAGMASLVYFIFFISDIFIPATVNSGASDIYSLTEILGNIGLLLLFGVQHSVMARPKFKLWLKKYMEPALERATFCLSTAIVLTMICLFWTPVNAEFWSVQAAWATYALQGFAVFGWTIMVLATFNIDHFELFGLRQVYCHIFNKPMPSMTFKLSGLYKWVRHPIQTGLLIGMWSVPFSTTSHVMLASGLTLYVFIGLYFEEQDLVREFGQTYRNYMKRVGRVIPKLTRTQK